MVSAAEKCLLEGKNTFMVVGMAHVLGEDGILALLKQKGYEPQLVSPGESDIKDTN